MQNSNIAVNDRVWPDFDVRRMSSWGIGYMPLKHLPWGWCGQNMKATYISYLLNPLGWCGWNMKAISYILQQSYTLLKTLTWHGPNIKAASWILQQLRTLFKTYTELKHGFKWQSMTWPWPRQKVKLRKRYVLLKGLTLTLVWAKY